MLRTVLLSVLALGAGASLAEAQSLQLALQEAGLLGRWAPDCSAPPSTTNIHSIFALDPSGAATMTQLSGPDKASRLKIVDAKLVSSDRLDYEVVYDDGARVRVVLMMTGRHIKAWHSQQSSGEVLIDRGRFTGNGRETPVRSRCG